MKYRKTFFFILGILFLVLSSCSPQSFNTENSLAPEANASEPNSPEPDAPLIEENFLPLSWEKTKPDSIFWSKKIFEFLKNENYQILDIKVSDMNLFCPEYENLNKTQKINFWGQLIVGIAKFESGWKPTTRYVETTMGTDPITGEKVVSEGLLQLSYQDKKYYGSGFCEFDWNIDKPLHLINPADPRKTILDPIRNLRCGLRILTRQIRSKRAIVIENGAYWAVIQKNNKNEKIEKISAITRELSFCQ